MEQHEAFLAISNATEQQVDWAYEVWDRFVRHMTDPKNRQRGVAAKILCNLAKSDPEHRIVHDFPQLMEVTCDKRIMTARKALQSIWRIGLEGDQELIMLLKAYEKRFKECSSEKNAALIRGDILRGMKSLHDVHEDSRVERLAKRLIQLESDRKQRKRFLLLWRKSYE
jgi:hypothetical protein